jgi:hypothetical protein
MTASDLLWRLPQRLTRALTEFIFHPSSYIHPDHQAVLYPPAWPAQVSAATSRALLQSLQLHSEPQVQLHQPLHRLALLPSDTLDALARWLGIAHQCHHLRRVVQRTDRLSLSELVSTAQWDWVYARAQTSQQRDASRRSADDIRHDVLTQGWNLLGLASQTLPSGVAQRFQLKLPRLNFSDAANTPEGALRQVEDVYAQTMPLCDPTWESQWQDALAGPSERRN